MNRRWAGMLMLAIAVVAGPLAGCSSAAKSLQLGDVDGAIRTLADGGIAVMEDVNSMTPLVALTGTPSAMRFTRWQMRALVTEADTHSGYLGSELDGIAKPPAGVPPFSTLIGAWLTRKDGALAQYAAGIMGPADYKHSGELVFPTIVVLTFIGDIARMGPTALHAQPRVDFERFIASPASADGICSDVAGWVTSVINNVTTAIQSNGTGWFSSLWNTVVVLAGTAVSIVINALAPLVAFITNIATVCGTLMQVASMFKPWSVQLTANPTSMMLSNVPGQGQFVATLHAEDVPWPTTLVDCVQSLAPGVKLDNASYTDAPVSWNAAATTPGLAVKTSEDDTLLKDKTAAYHFETKTGEVVPSCSRSLPAGKVAVTVTVARSDVTRTLNSLVTLITNQLPAAARAYLADYIRAALNDATSAAQQFGAPQASSVVAVSEQVFDPRCVPTPPPNDPSPVPTHVTGHGVLPSGTCQSVFTAADTAPLNGGIVFIPVDEHGNQVDIGAMMGSFAKGTFLNGPNGQQLARVPAMPHGTDYDTSEGSWCAVGTPPAKVFALVTVVPKGTLAYHPLPDLAANNAQYPRACRTAIGIDLLEYYNADCRDGSGFPATVTLYGPTVEYIITTADPAISANAINAVFRHIAQRSQH